MCKLLWALSVLSIPSTPPRFPPFEFPPITVYSFIRDVQSMTAYEHCKTTRVRQRLIVAKKEKKKDAHE